MPIFLLEMSIQATLAQQIYTSMSTAQETDTPTKSQQDNCSHTSLWSGIGNVLTSSESDLEESPDSSLLGEILRQQLLPKDIDPPFLLPSQQPEISTCRSRKRAVKLPSSESESEYEMPPPSPPLPPLSLPLPPPSPPPSSPLPPPSSATTPPLLPQHQKQRTRKHTQNEKDWKRNQTKKLKCSGQAYVTSRGKIRCPQQMKAGCGVTCRYHCKQKITKEQRQSIFDQYWALGNVTDQREFLARNVPLN